MHDIEDMAATYNAIFFDQKVHLWSSPPQSVDKETRWGTPIIWSEKSREEDSAK